MNNDYSQRELFSYILITLSTVADVLRKALESDQLHHQNHLYYVDGTNLQQIPQQLQQPQQQQPQQQQQQQQLPQPTKQIEVKTTGRKNQKNSYNTMPVL